jgi:UDP-glucose 4-epimerase
MRALIVGSTGLLGQALAGELQHRGLTALRPRIRWGTRDALGDLISAYEGLTASGGPWVLLWSAGVGITQTPQQVFDEEYEVVAGLVDHIERSGAASRGAVFFASSAGAAYAGSTDPPFTESTSPRPLAPYGHTRLRLERLVSRLADAGTRVAVGRIANLYGPGQNLSKPQGLISHLCLSIVRNRPLPVYVPLDTLRDYVYVRDAAAMVVDLLATVMKQGTGSPAVMKILASGQAVSIAEVLGELRLIARRRPPLFLASSPLSRAQTRDLRFRSTVFPELDFRSLTPFPVGIARTLADVGTRIRNDHQLAVAPVN